ncbi:hypothetical protein L207DRAFT_514502 [Hyaloscypha variabilis F]|uniref:Transcription factor domain-containing protein n=1 Tax=Hyaloscypha variabilis (strain UAMH 11265 / GT02V1 / F) TaxID=1149755 RepID=A0A2J6RF84_HYAVF|nr:hypothetical protein L207DRAFT_514502 [Hyaloscypha variabilis F]
MPLRSPTLSDESESLPEGDSDEPLQHLEFIAEEFHANDTDILPDARGSLQFVPETGTARPRGTLRDLIRSNARRKPRRRTKKSTQSKLHPLLVREKGSTATDPFHANEPPNSLVQRQPDITELRLSPSPEGSATDPFYTLPISDAGRSQFLTYHYQTVFAESDCPVNPRKDWIPFAMQDPALLHATLLFSAWQLATLHGNLPTPEVMYHKEESIRWLNKSLLKPNHIPTDSTIAVVACLTKVECLAANLSGIKLHMDGLETLVGSRGGIEALPDSNPRRLATWVDSEAAIVMETPPRFNLPTRENEERPENWGLYSSLAMLYEARLFHLTGLQDLSRETMQVYWGIHNLTGMKDAAIHLTKKVEFETWSCMVERLERRASALLLPEVVKSGKPKLAIFALFARAAIFHIYMFMRDLPRGLPFYRTLSDRFRASIEAMDLTYLHKEYPEMMLWILLMGGLGSSGTPNRCWFAERFAEICKKAGLQGGSAISYALAEFLWTELYRAPVTIGFWNDVARAQGIEGAYHVKALTDHISVAVFNAPPNMLEE